MKKIKDEIVRIKESVNKLNNKEDVDSLSKEIANLEKIINNEELLKLRGLWYVIQSINNIKKHLKIE